ncbi:hypothetical protein JKP88DRAFT_323834 [Tribonema minus]|uniref:Uncharacterized protein n=1 Tax=Tribonema minus TaxID=303371 RepID=A0A835YTK0_9STRA|nr:hypothetical protein JKP88DRAFT_323834 [Tribonema minus]
MWQPVSMPAERIPLSPIEKPAQAALHALVGLHLGRHSCQSSPGIMGLPQSSDNVPFDREDLVSVRTSSTLSENTQMSPITSPERAARVRARCSTEWMFVSVHPAWLQVQGRADPAMPVPPLSSDSSANDMSSAMSIVPSLYQEETAAAQCPPEVHAQLVQLVGGNGLPVLDITRSTGLGSLPRWARAGRAHNGFLLFLDAAHGALVWRRNSNGMRSGGSSFGSFNSGGGGDGEVSLQLSKVKAVSVNGGAVVVALRSSATSAVPALAHVWAPRVTLQLPAEQDARSLHYILQALLTTAATASSEEDSL